MKKIIFATNNKHKLKEVKEILGEKVEIISLADIGCTEDIPETSDTLEGNAALKVQYVFDKFHMDCFADDTGLEIEALNGRPGVYSARYAGEPSNSQNNIRKILHEMEGMSNRKAQFRTVIAFSEGSIIHYFEGVVKGRIANEPRGNAGFGYDPVFIPENHTKSFAELNPEIKNSISHRARAVKKFTTYLLSRNL
ncbi:MAG: non-canonical purine NTP diphosphatase [Paludibacteraceae bacterium]